MKSISDMPNLLSEWDKKNEIPPSQVSVWNKNKFGWVCKNNHLYFASAEKRYIGRGCPYCANKYVTKENNLEICFPSVIVEWDYDKNVLPPNSFLPKSSKKVWWKCRFGHEWEAIISNRIKGYGCPYCTNRIICEDNNLFYNFPYLMKEWDFSKNKIDPHKISCHNSRSAWWICCHGHSWFSVISSRTKGAGCPYCAGQKPTSKNNILFLNPLFFTEWDYNRNKEIDPHNVMTCSGIKVWWKCKRGHSWLTSPNNRSNNTNCPFCSKIELKNGMFFDSYAEAYYYLKNINGNFVKINGMYNKTGFKDDRIGKSRYDFYLEKENTYIEVTSYNSKNYEYWTNYLKKIKKKERYVVGVLMAKFKFIQIKISKEEKRFVDKKRVF